MTTHEANKKEHWFIEKIKDSSISLLILIATAIINVVITLNNVGIASQLAPLVTRQNEQAKQIEAHEKLLESHTKLDIPISQDVAVMKQTITDMKEKVNTINERVEKLYFYQLGR